MPEIQERIEQVDDLHFKATITVDNLTPDEKERVEREFEKCMRAQVDRMTGVDYGFGIR
jgi:hypothetical protein